LISGVQPDPAVKRALGWRWFFRCQSGGERWLWRSPRLAFIEKDGQRTQQRQIACRHGMTDLAMVFALGVVPPVLLADFDAPIIPHLRQHRVRAGLLGRQTEHAITGFASNSHFDRE
jgi:hypothetical protein